MQKESRSFFYFEEFVYLCQRKSVSSYEKITFMDTKFIDIQEEKEAAYRNLVRPKMMEDLKEKIINLLVIQKKYRESDFTARKMAKILNTNVRYISAVIRVQFHTNFATLVNKYRVDEAMMLLSDQRYADLTIEDISLMAGFAHRQSFYTAFAKFTGITPKLYRMKFESHWLATHHKDSKK